MKTLRWPIHHLPEPLLAGRFPLADRGFGTRYRGRFHALHLHGYSGSMHLAGQVIALRPGDLTISPAEQVSSYDLAQSGRHWCIHFRPTEEEGEAVSLPLHLSLGGATAAAEEQFAHIGRLLGSSRARDKARASLALQELLLWIDGRADTLDEQAVAAERAAAVIDERFDQPLTAAEIATAAGASQAYLARSFRRRFGVTIPHHLLQRRIAQARFLLESTDLPIWRVAERVGIPDPQHFNKSVRRILGESPTAIRRRAGSAPPVDPDR